MGVAACLRWEGSISMAQLISTHRHDFRWPTPDCLVPRAEAPNGKCVPPPPGGLVGDKLWCGKDRPRAPEPGPLEAPPRGCNAGDTSAPWCQRGPLTELINPRTASAPPQVRFAPAGCQEEPAARPWCEDGASPRPLAARLGVAPQQDTSRYDQPNQYLRKLCDKFPEPVSVITAKPRDELMRRVYADRYRTTYQSDYCHNLDDIARMVGECDSHDVNNNKYQSAAREGRGTPRGEGQYETCPCGCGCQVAKSQVQSAGDSGEPRIRPLACRPAAVSKNFHFSCCNAKRKGGQQTGDQVGPPEKIPPWVSEYNDSIGKTGQMIMEHKLLYPKKEKKNKM